MRKFSLQALASKPALLVTMAIAAPMLGAACGSDDSQATSGQPTTGGTTATSGTGAQGGSGAGESVGGSGGTHSGGQHAGGNGGSGGSGGEGGASACGAIGSPCNGSCPGGLVCYSGVGSDFCIPAAPDCGGFAGTRCQEPNPVCMMLSGADFGPCGTEAVKQCVCTHAPGAITDC